MKSIEVVLSELKGRDVDFLQFFTVERSEWVEKLDVMSV